MDRIWVLDVEKKKGATKIFFEKFISIILKKKLQKEIRDNEGEALNTNKKITQKLFDNWKRNLMEIMRSRQSGESEDSQNEVQKPSLKGKLAIIEEGSDEKDEAPIALSRKNKGKKRVERLGEMSLTSITDQPPKKKK